MAILPNLDAPKPPTQRRQAFTALSIPHQQAILEEVGVLLCDIRRQPSMLLVEQRQKIIDLVLDG